MKILVVDDDATLLATLKRGLRAMGHVVETALDAASALRLARTFRPDGVIADLQIGHDLGSELIRAMSAESLAATYVLHTGDHCYCAPSDLGAVPVLHKPCPTIEILAALEAGLRAARS